MYNYIKMEIYRLFHTKAPWVILLIMIGFNCFSVYTLKLESDGMVKDSSVLQATEDVGVMKQIPEEEVDDAIGIVIGLDSESAEEISVSQILGALINSRIMLLFTAIFVALFVHAEEQNGYIKNIAGQLKSRGFIPIANMVACLVYCLTMFMGCIPVLLFAKIIFGDKLILGQVGPMMEMLAVEYVLHAAFCILIMLFCMVTRGAAFGMASGIFISLGLLTPVYGVINKIFADADAADAFDIGKYMIENNVKSVVPGAAADVIRLALIIGVLFGAVCLMLSMLLLRRRDVR